MGLHKKAREHIVGVLKNVDEMPIEQVIEIVRTALGIRCSSSKGTKPKKDKP